MIARTMPEGWHPGDAATYSVEVMGWGSVFDIAPAGFDEWWLRSVDVEGPWDRVRVPRRAGTRTN